MAHGDAREGKWRGNWRMEWVASTLHTTSEHGVSSITTADAHNSAASSRLNLGPRRFKWTRPFRRKTKSGFCACAITFKLVSTLGHSVLFLRRLPHQKSTQRRRSSRGFDCSDLRTFVEFVDSDCEWRIQKINSRTGTHAFRQLQQNFCNQYFNTRTVHLSLLFIITNKRKSIP